MAMAVAANSLKLRLQLFVPHSTLPLMVDKLKVRQLSNGSYFPSLFLSLFSCDTSILYPPLTAQAENVEVNVTGQNWNEANTAAEAALAR